MQRLLIVAAIAIGIFAGSDCLTIKDGKIINRCGIWQFVTNSSLVLLIENKPVPSVSKVINLQNDNTRNINSTPLISTTNSTITYPISSSTIVTMPRAMTITSSFMDIDDRRYETKVIYCSGGKIDICRIGN